MKNISEKLATLLFSKDTDEEKIELYEFAIYILFSSALHIGSMLIIGWLFGMMIESIIFYVSFILIRKFAGGYHAKTPLKCYFLSVLTIVISLLVLKYLHINNVGFYILVSLTLVSIVVIMYLSPLNNIYKINDKEKRIFKTISVFNSIFLFIMSLLFSRFNHTFALSILLGIIISTTLLVFGRIQNNKKNDQE